MTILFKRALKLSTVPAAAILVTYGIAVIYNYPFWLLDNKFRVLRFLFEPAVMVRRGLFPNQETYIYQTSIGPIDIVGLFIFYFLVALLLATCWNWIESKMKIRA